MFDLENHFSEEFCTHGDFFFAKILLKTFKFVIRNISELDFEEKKSDEIVLHPMHGGRGAFEKIPQKVFVFSCIKFCLSLPLSVMVFGIANYYISRYLDLGPPDLTTLKQKVKMQINNNTKRYIVILV